MRTSTFRGISIIVGLVAVVLAGCHIGGDAFRAKYTRSEDLTVPLADIATLDLTTNVGRIEVTAADVPEIRISAVIKVKAATEEKAQASKPSPPAARWWSKRSNRPASAVTSCRWTSQSPPRRPWRRSRSRLSVKGAMMALVLVGTGR
jgi:hypothetical protein